ncbi:MAG: hypothetical protein FJ088_15590, partial [Deltaproteobacteria bacterium]|nr:hypothetical protein [Deltaproteobacteria bacterium]
TIASHPPDLPLAFVKTPLCMLPSGEEHRTLEAKYISEGTVLTFNHVEADMITSDTLSVSANRDIAKNLRSHPYRWICAGCGLVPMCRFDRVDWFHRHFEPTKEQKPAPYSDVTASNVLSRLGKVPAAAKELEKAARKLRKRRFPEKEILDALSRRTAGEPEMAGAWIDKIPLFVAEFKHRGFKIPLQIIAPSGREDIGGADAVIGWAIVRSLAENEVPRDIVKECLYKITGALPPAERMHGESWFDVRTAALFQSAWSVFREGIWPDSGSVGRWQTRRLAFGKSGRLFVEMHHGSGVIVEVKYEIEIIELRVKEKSPRGDDFLELADFISVAKTGSHFSIPGAPFREIREGAAFYLKDGIWRLRKPDASEISNAGNLSFVVRDPAVF